MCKLITETMNIEENSNKLILVLYSNMKQNKICNKDTTIPIKTMKLEMGEI